MGTRWVKNMYECIFSICANDGLHIDLVRAPEQLDDVLAKLNQDQWLSLGLVDGRNIWKNNLATKPQGDPNCLHCLST